MPPNLFTGVSAAVLTPVDDNLDVDQVAFNAHCRWLLATGCDFLSILGTTGEANSFSVAERAALIEDTVTAGIPAKSLMVGTGACAVPDAVALCKIAVKAGTGGVLMLPPFYYKSPSDDGLFAYYAEIIERVGDERLKIYLYHIPPMSAVPLSYALIGRLIERYPDTVVGIKDSSGDLHNMTGMVREFPGFVVLSGADNLLLPLLEAGGHGCITNSCNVAQPLAAEIFRTGSVAAQDTLSVLRDEIIRGPFVPRIKALLAQHTGQQTWKKVRPPFTETPDAELQVLAAQFEAAGYTPPPVSAVG